MLTRSFIIAMQLLNLFILRAQDSLVTIPSGYINKLSAKLNRTEEMLANKSENIIDYVKTQEKKVQQKLSEIDPAKAQRIFGDIEERYENFEVQLLGSLTSHHYNASLDTIISSLKF